jgi:AcrR family transcriptional regulator
MGDLKRAPSGIRSLAVRSRMPRVERRAQILETATSTFARAGYAGTSLDDIAREAGVSRVILYRHFESKADLYRAVLERAYERLAATVPGPEFSDASVDGLVSAAAEDPAGFRLLFQHAAREPEFREEMDKFRAEMVTLAHRQLARIIRSRAWSRWAAELATTVAIEAVLAWLEAGQPDPARTPDRVRQAIRGVIEAAGRS